MAQKEKSVLDVYPNTSVKNKVAGILSKISLKSKESILNQVDFDTKTSLVNNASNKNIDICTTKQQVKTVSAEVVKEVIPEQKKVEQVTPVDTVEDSETIEVVYGNYKLVMVNDEDRVIVQKIEPYTYNGVVTVPEGVTHIDNNAFDSCKAIAIILPESLVYIGESAFSQTNFLEMHLPSKITAIPHNCFYKANLRVINLENITSIGNYSFTETNIVEVHLKSEVIQIGLSAFQDCKSLNIFTHMNTLKKIRERAFDGCILLEEFDLNGVSEIESMAFCSTALKSVKLGGDVTYTKTHTFTSDYLETVEIEDGCYKLADGCFVNRQGNPIKYTIPKSVNNIGVHLFTENDTVRCYHTSIAESTAKMSGSRIEYLDDITRNVSKTIAKANMLNMDIQTLIGDMITDIYSKSDMVYEYTIDQSKLFKIDLNNEMLSYVGLPSIATPNGYTENPKFRALLEHYNKACPADGFGLSGRMLALKNTFSIENKVIYDDGVSRIVELKYSDHKFESKKAKYILAMTGNTVRYCCFNNRFTDVYCATTTSKDMSKLLGVLVPGDTIGYNCTIAGVKYESIAGKGDIKNKQGERLSMNIYQALFNCSIAIKLDRNNLALLLPANGKIIKCASLGKSVWNNENDESYKNKYCVITDIQDIKGNTILEYGSNSPSRDDMLFKEIKQLSNEAVQERIKTYSNIGESIISPYMNFQAYCEQSNVEVLEYLDLRGLGFLLALPVIEERRLDWFNASVDKTIVAASKHEIQLIDGTTVYQYKTVKRVAMRNKLLTGGDRTVYIFEIYNKNLYEPKVMASMLDLDELFTMAKTISTTSLNPVDIYQRKSDFDVVNLDDMILITAAFVNTHEKDSEENGLQNHIWLTVYKPNGRYYLSYIYKNDRNGNLAVPMIQIGDFDVLLDYIDCANTLSAVGYNTLIEAGTVTINNYIMSKRGYTDYAINNTKLLQARNLAISGHRDTDSYLKLKLSPVLCHMFGVVTE